MSDHLPSHIQEEIMKRLPVKSLVQFRCVSKAWKSIIDRSEFVSAHSLRSHTHQQHLVVSYDDLIFEKHYVCFVDDETFPQQRSDLSLPVSAKQRRLLGSSHGLLCLYHYQQTPSKTVILWNPLIRKSVVVTLPDQPYITFGVCPVTSDPKIFSINQSWDESDIETSYRCKVMVYTLSSRKWKTLSSNLPTKPLRDFWSMVVTDRFIYWHSGSNHNMLMSFDVTTENFELIDLPDSLATHDPWHLYLSKIRGSLAILQNSENMKIVWKMEHGVEKTFRKLFVMETPHDIVGFRKSGVPIMQVTDDDHEDGDAKYKLVVYDPNSKHNNVAEISGSPYSFCVHSHMETLILLGQSDCNRY